MKTKTSSLFLSLPFVFATGQSIFALGLFSLTLILIPSAGTAQTVVAPDVPVVVPAPVPGGVTVVAPAGSATVTNAQVVSANGVVDVSDRGRGWW